MNLWRRLQTSRFGREVLFAPLEYMLHDSDFRIRGFGWALVLGEPLYYWIWAYLIPQPAESLFIRASCAIAALPIALQPSLRFLQRHRLLNIYLVALTFYTLPLSFLALYVMNGFNEVWMGSCVCMIFLTFLIIDWRLALASIVSSVGLVAAASWAGILARPPGSAAVPGADLAILGFALFTATLFSMSAANLRRERARSALVTMGVLAHEFRTPLAAASMVTQSMAQSPEARRDPHLVRGLDKLSSLFNSMNAQINFQMGNARLLDMPREKEVADVATIAAEAVAAFPLPASASRDCVQCVAPKGAYALVHRELMKQVVNNLLSNAIKASIAKNPFLPTACIRVTCEADSKQVRLTVADDGIGISPERLNQIFEPFQSTSQFPSHGLGLTMCRNAVTSFGGEIACASELGAGSQFTITLPLASVAARAGVLDE